MKLIKWLDDHFEEILLVLCLIAITLVSFVQVIVRKIPGVASFTWAEEFCRFAWIWSVFLSVPYTIKNRSMLRVTVVLDLLPQTARKILDILVDLTTIACMALLFYHSFPVLNKMMFPSGGKAVELSPAMRWPMWWMYIFMLLGFGLAVLRGVETLIHHITHFGEKQLTTTEQAQADAKAEIEAARGAEGMEGGDA